MKRIVLCADGTWNGPGQNDATTGRPRPSNVLKVARAVRAEARHGVEQVVFYLPGCGVEHDVRALYRFLVFNYMRGDDLYFFGFSRGAFTVRALAGFLNAAGLLDKEDEGFAERLYALYASGVPGGAEPWQRAFGQVRRRRECPPILFVGVWDTVGAPSVLAPLLDRANYRRHEIGLQPQIAHAYHALAIDERRAGLAPRLFMRPQGWPGVLEQAWFPGDHRGVGGGGDADSVAHEALHWIVEKAEALGLQCDQGYLAQCVPRFDAPLHGALPPLSRLRTRLRAVGQHGAHGEALHQCALDRMRHAECAYTPANLGTAEAGRLPVVNTTRIARGTPTPPVALRAIAG